MGEFNPLFSPSLYQAETMLFLVAEMTLCHEHEALFRLLI